MNRLVFFVGTATNAWLRYPAWYGLFDYNLLYTNALIGVTIAIANLAKSLKPSLFLVGSGDPAEKILH